MRNPLAVLAFALACTTGAAAAAPQTAAALPVLDPAQQYAQEQWILSIMQRVQQNWLRPAEAGPIACTVDIEQDRRGNVLRVELRSSCGSHAIDRSIARAIQLSSPLPPAPDEAVFEPSIRFRFTHGDTPQQDAVQ